VKFPLVEKTLPRNPASSIGHDGPWFFIEKVLTLTDGVLIIQAPLSKVLTGKLASTPENTDQQSILKKRPNHQDTVEILIE
jgi:hypothetical protein